MREPAGAVPTVAGILGSPDQVASSLSPAIHNAAFKALELNWLYLTLGVDSPWLKGAIRGLASGGVGGMNVTLPHKVQAMEAMDSLSRTAEQIGAINTIEVKSGKLVGWNTDGEGLVRFLKMDAGARVAGAEVVVLGAGGAARAAVYSLAAAGVASICVLARDQNTAAGLQSLAPRAQFEASEFRKHSPEVVERASIIINATPLGQKGEKPPIDTEKIRPEAVVVDMVYRPPVTSLVEGARVRGAIAHSGLGMLLHQAALAFEIWTGLEPPMDAMSAAALSQLNKSC